jgi:hypothetical protein
MSAQSLVSGSSPPPLRTCRTPRKGSEATEGRSLGRSDTVTGVAYSHLDSPAGRMLDFMDGIRLLLRSGFPPGTSNFDHLANLLGTEGHGEVARAALFLRIGDVLDLPRQIRAAVLATSKTSDTFTEVLPEVERWLQGLVGNLNNQGLPEPAEALCVTMKLCSEQLSLNSAEQVPDLEELAAIREELNTLVGQVVDADLDPDLATFLVSHLRDLLEGIDRFRISGVAPIRKAVQDFVGDVTLRREASETFKSSTTGSKLADRVWATVGRLALIVNLSAGGIEIGTTAMHALTAGH